MKAFVKVLALALFVVPFGFQPQAASAADHPAYLRALQNLRYARAYLEAPGPNGHIDEMEGRAIREIDYAIKEIKDAAIDDGKDLHDHPPIDNRGLNTDRYHRAIELLDRAHNDVRKDEDNQFAQGLQARALRHIDLAHDVVVDTLKVLVQ